MNAELIAELHDVLSGIAADTSCRVVLLTGSGRGFCAGLDLGGYGSAPGSEGLGRVERTFATQTHIAALVPLLRSLPQPVIAAVNGPAAGGGLALALASDIRIAASSARFNVAFVRLGISGCDIGVSWLLPRLIGASRAWELMLTGRIIGAEEADRIGLVLRVVPDDDLIGAALGDGGPHSRQQHLGHPDDQGGDVVAARGGVPPGGHRPREPDPGPLLHDGRHAGGGGRLPREATASLRRHGESGPLAPARRLTPTDRHGYVGTLDAGPRQPDRCRRQAGVVPPGRVGRAAPGVAPHRVLGGRALR